VGRIGLGFVLETIEDPVLRYTPRWAGIRRQALLAESVGFDTLWVADELQWESDDWEEPVGCWECVAVTGAVAASTTSVQVGTWVLSALHRNAGLTARIAETLAEISGGRFILGFGSGHAGRQAEAFGFPPNYTVSRYEEALSILLSLRTTGRADFSGSYHNARGLVMVPRPAEQAAIPLMLGGHKPRTMRLAAEHANHWSAFVTTSSQPEAFAELLEQIDVICEEVGRDPSTLGKSIGVVVAPPDTEPSGLLSDYDPIRGSVGQIVDAFRRFADMGCTRLEIMAAGEQDQTIEGLAPVLEELRRG
jgi:alkanesulfonate monooxygenase SsuD/methylene tetrahydromethanopterin reductase-like flavin-dependent oxidoreductase (luciferase family)